MYIWFLPYAVAWTKRIVPRSAAAESLNASCLIQGASLPTQHCNREREYESVTWCAYITSNDEQGKQIETSNQTFYSIRRKRERIKNNISLLTTEQERVSALISYCFICFWTTVFSKSKTLPMILSYISHCSSFVVGIQWNKNLHPPSLLVIALSRK